MTSPTKRPTGPGSEPVVRSRSTGDGATVDVRPHLIERAIANLVDTAVEYSPGPIELVLDGHRFEVRDEGPGFDTEDIPHVFGRFYRSNEARTEPGSGLGLVIVQQIVDRHGGTVWATDRPEGVAAVGFELPPRRWGEARLRW